MQTNQTFLSRSLLSLSVCMALVSCGGDSRNRNVAENTPAPGIPAAPVVPVDPPGTPLMATVSLRVIDGYVEGAIACADLNGNGNCDGDEPAAKTDVNSIANIELTQQQYKNLEAFAAVIGPGASDQTWGAFAHPIYLSAMKSDDMQEVARVVSAMSTLVHFYARLHAVDRDTAVAAIRDRFAARDIDLDPLADHVASQNETNMVIGHISRVLILAQQELMKNAGVDFNVLGAINNTLIFLLDELLDAATDPAILAATDNNTRNSLLLAKAEQFAQSAGLDGPTLTSIAEGLKTPRPALPPSDLGQPVDMLRYLRYTDAGSYEFVAFRQSAEQNTPLANGVLRFSEYQAAMSTPGVHRFIPMDVGHDSYQNRTIWNGNEWISCPKDAVHEKSQPDGRGPTTVRYCGAIDYTVKQETSAEIARYPIELIRKKLEGAYRRLGGDSTTAFLPEPLIWPANVIPGAMTFADGAQLITGSREEANPPDTYDENARPQIFNYRGLCLDYEEGENYVGDLLEFPAFLVGLNCQGTAIHGNTWNYRVLNLMPGNMGLSENTISVRFSADIGDLPNPAVTYLRCDATATVCTEIGHGSFRIEPLGTGGDRVMRFEGLPLEVAGRTFVERDDKVYYGVRRPPSSAQRFYSLNRTASQDLLKALNLPAIGTP